MSIPWSQEAFCSPTQTHLQEHLLHATAEAVSGAGPSPHQQQGQQKSKQRPPNTGVWMHSPGPQGELQLCLELLPLFGELCAPPRLLAPQISKPRSRSAWLAPRYRSKAVWEQKMKSRNC